MAGSCGSCSLGRALDIASTVTAKTSAQARATATETRKRSRSFLCQNMQGDLCGPARLKADNVIAMPLSPINFHGWLVSFFAELPT